VTAAADDRALRSSRAAGQLLAGSPARSAAEVAGRLLAVQAQNLRSARLAVRARTAGLTAADVNRELEQRSVVIAWLCRGTLHLVRREDYPWLLSLTAPGLFTGNRTRLAQLGFSPDRSQRAVALIERELAGGPLTRAELRQVLARAGVAADGQAMVHLLFLASLHGGVIRGPFRGGEQAWVLTRDWLGAAPDLGEQADRRPAALAELARGYLRGHGPASAADLAVWSGLPLRDARAGLEEIAGELREVPGGRVRLAGPAARPRKLPPRLLPSFDPYLLGWADRAFAVPADRHDGMRSGGIIRAAAIVAGFAVGTWDAPRAGRRVTVRLDLWGSVSATERAALRAEADDVVRFEAAASGGAV
jgi:winged helix DNA-binding protein